MWVRKKETVEKDPNFLEEDRLLTLDDYFMTSRFDLELDSGNNTFRTFCENVEMFVDLIKSIKPITKILNLIKYTIRKDLDVNLVYDLVELVDEANGELEYRFTWDFDSAHLKSLENVKRLCTLDEATGTADLFCLDYRPNVESSVKCPPMVYNVIGKFLKSNFESIHLTMEAEMTEKATADGVEFEVPATTTYTFTRDGMTPILNAGSFFLCMTGATNGTNCYNMVNRFFKFSLIESGYLDVHASLKFRIQHGTNFARSFPIT